MPRVAYSIEEVHAECERQRAAIASGNMRRLGGVGFAGVTVEWEQAGEYWRWHSTGTYYGGLWKNEGDREQAWQRALKEWPA